MDKRKDSNATTLAVHRCRFVDYAPSAITALAFPPLPLPSVKKKKRKSSAKQLLRYGTLAIGHANGNIDLCEWAGSDQSAQCQQAWVTRKTLPGPYPSKVDSLTFVIRYPDTVDSDEVPSLSDLRLFSSGGGSELLEWDLDLSCIKRTISSQGGAIWCVAANPSSTYLALGCEDGTIRLLSIVDDTLIHHRRFDRVNCRILSLAWGPPTPKLPQSRRVPDEDEKLDTDSENEDDEDAWTDSWLVTGGSDSSIRKWDAQAGRAVERMVVDKIRGERTLVWTVGVLGDGTIVSGDSLGHVKFWDSRTCTQIHSFQAHGADVLCLTINPEGKAVYTSGVDQKTVQFSLVKTSSSSTSSHTTSRWAQTASRRMHSHDVRALASWPPYTPLPPSYRRTFPLDVAPILASGGLDMSVVLSPAALPESTLAKVVNPLATSVDATFGDAYHRKLAYTVGSGIRISRTKRLVLCLREAGLSVWKIAGRPESADDINGEEHQETVEPWAGGWEKVLEMELNITSNLTSGELSDNGRWLAVSDMYETKLFSLRTDDQDSISVKRIKDFPALIHSSIPNPSQYTTLGSTALRFTPDSSKLILTTTQTSYILIFDLVENDRPRLLRRFEHHRLQETKIRDRVVKGLKQQHKNQANGVLTNGKIPEDVEDVEMASVAEEQNESDASAQSENDEVDDQSPLANPIPSVLQITVSPDGQWFATSDDQRRTHIFNLDTISHHTLLPTFPLPTQCLAFSPFNPSILFLAFPDNTLQVYDVESRQFPHWSKDLSPSSATAFPVAKRLSSLHDPILGICFPPAPRYGLATKTSNTNASNGKEPVPMSKENESDVNKSRYALLWGANWFLKLPLSPSCISRKLNKKRRRPQSTHARVQGQLDNTGFGGEEESLTSSSIKLITHYRPILHMNFLTDGELVIIERPLIDVFSTLPPAYFKHKYGSS